MRWFDLPWLHAGCLLRIFFFIFSPFLKLISILGRFSKKLAGQIHRTPPCMVAGLTLPRGAAWPRGRRGPRHDRWRVTATPPWIMAGHVRVHKRTSVFCSYPFRARPRPRHPLPDPATRAAPAAHRRRPRLAVRARPRPRGGGAFPAVPPRPRPFAARGAPAAPLPRPGHAPPAPRPRRSGRPPARSGRAPAPAAPPTAVRRLRYFSKKNY